MALPTTEDNAAGYNHSLITSGSVLAEILQYQFSPLSLVEECRGLALISREVHSVAPPALLCHKEPKPLLGLYLLLVGSLWHKG